MENRRANVLRGHLSLAPHAASCGTTTEQFDSKDRFKEPNVRMQSPWLFESLPCAFETVSYLIF